MRLFFILSLFVGLVASPSLANKKKKSYHWTIYGQRLFGESWQVQNHSKNALLNYPNLDQELKKAIRTNTHRELAADVIAALKLYKHIDVLVENSKEDSTGHLYLAMNSLLTDRTRDILVNLYALRLRDPQSSLPAKVIMLDTLGRLKHKLNIGLLVDFLSSSPFELRSSTLNYMRRLKTQFSNKEFRQLARLALQSPWYQIRLRAIYSLPHYFIDFELCEKDSNKWVRKKCQLTKTNKEINW